MKKQNFRITFSVLNTLIIYQLMEIVSKFPFCLLFEFLGHKFLNDLKLPPSSEIDFVILCENNVPLSSFSVWNSFLPKKKRSISTHTFHWPHSLISYTFLFPFPDFQYPDTVRTQIPVEMVALISSNGLFYWNDRRHEVYFLQKSGSDQRDSKMISFSNDRHCTLNPIAIAGGSLQVWIFPDSDWTV